MSDIITRSPEVHRSRRTFLGTLAAAVATSATASAVGATSIPRALGATPVPNDTADPERWLQKLTGKHRQLVDGFAPNDEPDSMRADIEAALAA